MLNLRELIYTRRTGCGMSQAELARLANVSRHTVVNVETGKGTVTLEMAERLLGVFGLMLAARPVFIRTHAVTVEKRAKAWQAVLEKLEGNRDGTPLTAREHQA